MAEESNSERRGLVEVLPRPRLTAVAGERPRPLVVLGAAGSGDGLCARVLGLCGCDVDGGEIGRLNGAVFALFADASEGPWPSGWWADARVQPLRRDLVVLLRRKSAEAVPFGLCDPLLPRLLPLWHRVFADAGIVPRLLWCLRDPAQTGADGDPEEAAYRWFADTAAIAEFAAHYEAEIVDYEAWFADPDGNLDRLARLAGLGVDAGLRRAVAEVVDDEKGRAGRTADAVQPLVRTLYTLVHESAEEPARRAELRDLVARFAEFERLVRPLRRRADAERTALAAARAELEAALAELATRDLVVADALAQQEEQRAAIEQLQAALAEQEAELARNRRRLAEAEAAAAREREARDLAQAAAERDLAAERSAGQARETAASDRLQRLEARLQRSAGLLAERSAEADRAVRLLAERGAASDAEARRRVAALNERIAVLEAQLAAANARAEEPSAPPQSAPRDRAGGATVAALERELARRDAMIRMLSARLKQAQAPVEPAAVPPTTGFAVAGP